MTERLRQIVPCGTRMGDHHAAGNDVAKDLRSAVARQGRTDEAAAPPVRIRCPPKCRGQRRPVTVKVAFIVACEESPAYNSICPGSTMKSPRLS